MEEGMKTEAAIPRRDSDITVGELRHLLGRDDPLIIEVGCNDCETTAKMLAVMPNARIICFEPDPRPLERNVCRGDKRVKINRVAISDRYGEKTFYQSGGEVPHSAAPCKDDWDYSGSLHMPTGHLERDKLVKFPSKIIVQTAPLDSFMAQFNVFNLHSKTKTRQYDLLWADPQGSQARIILGGQKTLWRTRYFYCEFYDIEQYEREPDLKGLLSFLPDWDLVGIYADNALFRNREIQP